MSDFVIHYDFTPNSINNNQLFNSALNQYDATLKNSTISNNGPNNSIPSLNFNQSNQNFITINPKTTLGSGLTISFWINLTVGTNSSKYSLIHFSNGSSGQYISMEAEYNSSNGIISINLGLSGSMNGSNNIYQQTVNLGSANNWYHITWTLTSGNIWNFYINGILSNSFSNVQYPIQVYRDLMYIGKQYGSSPQYFYGSIADFRLYNSALNQTNITYIFTNYSTTPNAPNIMEKGFDQMYNQIFCNFMPTSSNNFNNCSNCNYGDNMNINSQSTVSGGQSECELNCKNNSLCTSYSYNSNNGNCTQYSNFPDEVYTGVNNIYSGYNLNYSFDYNNLNESQQNNVKNKCTLQYTNRQFTPDKQIDLGKCLNYENGYNSSTYLKYDPECVFNKYSENGVNLNIKKISEEAVYTSNNDYNQSVGDPELDKYQSKYDSYIQDKVQLSNINNVMSIQDPSYDSGYLDTVKQNNNIYGTNYIKSINNLMDPLKNISSKIKDKVQMINELEKSNEGFENNISGIGHNFLRLLIFIVIISIIFTIIFNICK